MVSDPSCLLPKTHEKKATIIMTYGRTNSKLCKTLRNGHTYQHIALRRCQQRDSIHNHWCIAECWGSRSKSLTHRKLCKLWHWSRECNQIKCPSKLKHTKKGHTSHNEDENTQAIQRPISCHYRQTASAATTRQYQQRRQSDRKNTLTDTLT